MRRLIYLQLLLLALAVTAIGQVARNSATDHLAQAMADRNNGNFDAAIAEFTKAIKIDPLNTMAYYNRARVREGKHDFDGAIADYSKAAEIEPMLCNAYHGRAVARRAKGNLDGAIADISKCIEIDPDGSSLYYGERGEVLFAKGDYDGAIADFTKVIVADPQSVTAYNFLGSVEKLKGNLDAAIANFNKAIEFDCVRYGYYTAVLYNNLAATLREKGDLEAALANFNKALEFFPDFASAYAGRGLIYLEQGKDADAEQDFARSLRLDSSLKSQLDRETEKVVQRRKPAGDFQPLKK